MRIIYLECSMGSSGDMLMAALFELINGKVDFLKQINSLGLPGVRVDAKHTVKNTITGTHMKVSINDLEELTLTKTTHNEIHKYNHNNLKKIENIIAKLAISKKIKDNALNIYYIIAKAEAKIHGQAVRQIHFHEIGNMDALVDIIGVCILMESLKPQELIVSPINVGNGFVHCIHGILPVPAPSTAYILQNIPIYNNENVSGELCTPTGAAIIKYFATRFGEMPKMWIQKIGYGMGTKNFEIVNCLRAFLGKYEDTADTMGKHIVQLQCNLDDMTGEAIGFTIDLLLQKGALDVFNTPIQMKKNRPAILLTCICNEDKADFFAKLMLRYTTTFGVRKIICDRYVLDHKISMQKTPYGSIHIKMGEGYNVKKSKVEYEDIAKLALLHDKSFNETNNIINKLRKKDEYKTKV